MKPNIVIFCGLPAAGKTTAVKEYVDSGYYRINRDLTGGTLDGQTVLVKKAFAEGKKRIVIDNTYITTESRKSIVSTAKELKVPIDCVWLKTSFEDAQLNACLRMVEKTGKILSPEDFKTNKDPNLFPPIALYAARKNFQSPEISEGFSNIIEKEFVRNWASDYVNEADIFDFDDTIRKSKGPNAWPEKPEHVEILPGRILKLKHLKKKGKLLLGASNQSAVAKGLPEKDCIACFEQTFKLLGVKFEYLYCPHKVPPVSCFCRKPAPAMMAYFIVKYKLDPSKCVYVGDSTTDETFANRCGCKFKTPEDYFGA